MTIAANKPSTGSTDAALSKHAVLYLRVSTTRQMDTAVDIDADSNSISTQREFAVRRAQNVDAVVDREFVEPGNSAQTIDKRPVFRELLKYVAEHPEVDYVIIYMRSRAFRNLADAVVTKRKLDRLGVKLISAKEDFGEGYMADAMEAVTDIFNELEVRRNGEDIKAKLRHKAINGGTISRAKLGYLNIRAEQDGRLYNSIGLDPVRAPLVAQVWKLYATDEFSMDQLQAASADLGLLTRPTKRWPREQPVHPNKLHQMLRDPYYAGWIVHEGVLYPGRHEPIITQELFDRVQDVLEARSRRGQRDRILKHYLKGFLFCGRCKAAGRVSRLIYTEARSRSGSLYGYFVCMGRQRSGCDLRHLPAVLVEDSIVEHYQTLDFGEEFIRRVQEELQAVAGEQLATTRDLQRSLAAQLRKLNVREDHLIDLTGLRPSPTRRAVLRLGCWGLRSGRMSRDGGAGRVYDCAVAVVGRGGRLIPNRSP